MYVRMFLKSTLTKQSKQQIAFVTQQHHNNQITDGFM